MFLKGLSHDCRFDKLALLDRMVCKRFYFTEVRLYNENILKPRHFEDKRIDNMHDIKTC
jgi:hypothetical protein